MIVMATNRNNPRFGALAAAFSILAFALLVSLGLLAINGVNPRTDRVGLDDATLGYATPASETTKACCAAGVKEASLAEKSSCSKAKAAAYTQSTGECAKAKAAGYTASTGECAKAKAAAVSEGKACCKAKATSTATKGECSKTVAVSTPTEEVSSECSSAKKAACTKAKSESATTAIVENL